MSDRVKSSHDKFKKNAKKTLYKDVYKKKKTKSECSPSYLEKISESLNLPGDILAGAPIITATGRNELCLENFKSIIEFNGNQIKIQTKHCRICIEGKNLNILYFTEDEMLVRGYIQAIYYQ